MFTVRKFKLTVPSNIGFCNSICLNTFFYGMVVVFNKVSRSRIKLVGPDRACAEWLMRNGAFIKWQGSASYTKSYDNLPLKPEDKGTYFLKEVDATDAGISHHGFPHFDGCKHVDKIKMVNCAYVENKAIELLHYVKNSLEDLEISHCKSVTDEGLRTLKNLGNLKTLKFGGLNGVKDINSVVNELRKDLPACEIQLRSK